MFWFVDFSKIGKGNKKIKISDVLKTVVNILTCFNLKENLGDKAEDIFEKYKDAIEKFYTARWRPTGKPALIPTLQGCEGLYAKVSFDETRIFTTKKMMPVF